ncbi:MAG: Ig-like domain-containing protein, partial [Anaerolineae bacterium]|nr:Ig-like domain-containing protein [Anaerolineae bacterium]
MSHRALFTDSIGSDYVFSLDMVAWESGEVVTDFAQPVTVGVRYTAEMVNALGGQLLRLLIFDAKAGWWVPLDSQVDKTTQRVTSETERTGVLSLTGSTDEGAVTGILQPSVLGLQPSLWTGDASFGYAIETPPGPGGFGPAVSLSYSNGAANGMLQQVGGGHKVQAGFAGLGWDLGGVGHISRDGEGQYHLNFSGGSFELNDPDDDGWWATDPESFLRIYHPRTTYVPVRWEAVSGGCPSGYVGQAEVRYRDTDAWTVWSKDGTRFTFGGDWQSNGVPMDLGATPIKWGGWLDCGSTCYADPGAHTCSGGLFARPYRWNLTEVRDTHANAYQVSYAHTVRAISDNTDECSSLHEVIPGEQYVRDSRPTAITYGDGRLEIKLEAANDRNDAPGGLDLDDTHCMNQAVWSDWRLEQIQVRVDDPSPGWQDVRTYELGGHKQGHHWVLDTVAWAGAGGTETTPPYTFAYATKDTDNGVFLSQAANGYGGSAALSYEDKGDGFPACGRWVVSQRVVADGLGNTALTAYAYQPAAAAGWWCGDEEYEFLGFGTATQTVYDLNSSNNIDHKVVTEFHQGDDARKGKEQREQVRGPDDSLLHETQHTWAADGTWARLDASVEKSCGYGTCQSSKTTYYYDLKWQNCGGSGTTQYGNVTRVEDYESETAATPYRTTLTAYCPNTSGWIVDKPAFQNLYTGAIDANNPGGNQLEASTWYVYSDNQDSPPANWNQAVGSKGELRGVRRVLQWTPSWQVVDTRYRHDAFGNVTHETVYNSYGTDTAWASTGARTTTTDYDATHTFPLTVTNPRYHSTTMEYYGVNGVAADHGLLGQMKKITDPNGVWAEYRYDSFGRLTHQKRSGDGLGWDAADVSLYRGYFDMGTAGLQHVTTWLGRGDHWEEAYVDGLGRIIQTHRLKEGVTEIRTTTGYDARGQVAKEWVPYEGSHGEDGGHGAYGYVPPAAGLAYTGYQYDALGRTTRATHPDGTFTVFRHHVVLNPVDPDFSVARAAVLVRDANGHFTRQSFDAFGRLQTVSEFLAGAWSDPDNWPESWAGEARTHYVYDMKDNLTNVTDAAGNVTTMQYDMLGRKTSMDDPDMGEWHYYYDLLGNLIAQVDAKLQAINFYYDDLNRLTGKTYDYGPVTNPANYQRPADPDPNYDVAYYYDGATCADCRATAGEVIGQRTAMENSVSRVVYSYDDIRGRLSMEQRWIKDGVSAGTWYTTTYTYDAMDRNLTMTPPGNEVLTTTYNAQGLPNTLSGNTGYVLNAGYNEMGQLEDLNLSNVVAVDYGFYPPTEHNGRLQSIVVQGATENWLDLEYDYDSVGNVKAITDTIQGGQAVQGFEYDELNRLTHAGIATGPQAYDRSYDYDEIGNIRSFNGMTYGYGAKPHAVTTVGGKEYKYDENGNMTSRDGQSSRWTIENRLEQVVTGDGSTITYYYDGDGTLVKKVGPDKSETYYVGNYYEEFIEVPRVVAVNPTREAADVPLDTNLAVTFNKPIVDPGDAYVGLLPPVGGTKSVQGETVWFTPTQNLEGCREYTASIGGYEDTDGRLMDPSPYTWSFTTVNDQAQVTGTVPDDGQEDVPLGMPLTITFDEDVTCSAGDCVTVSPQTAGSLEVEGNVATFTATAGWAECTAYTATAKDFLDADCGIESITHQWGFTTEAIPPQVTAVEPLSGTVDVALTPVIRVTFDEPVFCPGDNCLIVINLRSGTQVPGTLTVQGSTASFSVDGALEESTWHTVTAAGFKDACGEPMATPYTWKFETVHIRPQVSAVWPKPDDACIPADPTLWAWFTEEMNSTTPLVFTLAPVQGGQPGDPVGGDAAWVGSMAATFTPSSALTQSWYEAHVEGPEDLYGNKLIPYTWQFGGSDLTPPQVVETVPEDGAVDVYPDEPVSAWFDEWVGFGIVVGHPFELTGPHGLVDGTYGLLDQTELPAGVRFTPTVYLTENASFAASVSVRDLCGNQTWHTWVFRTGCLIGNQSLGSSIQVQECDGTSCNLHTISILGAKHYYEWRVVDAEGNPVVSEGGDPPREIVVTEGPDLRLEKPYPGESYFVKVRARDAAGCITHWSDELDYNWEAAHPGPPAVVATAPLHGALGVALTPTIVVTFSEVVFVGWDSPLASAQWAGFHTPDLSLLLDGQPVHGRMAVAQAYDEHWAWSLLLKVDSLKEQTTYVGHVVGAMDAHGNEMTVRHEWSFTTADFTAPYVVSTDPAPGASEQPTTTLVTAHFQEPLQGVSGASFTLAGPQGPVSGTVTYLEQPEGGALRFTPAAPLEIDNWYQATVVGASDDAGNVMTEPYNWYFSTGTLPALTPASTAQEPGAVGVPLTATVAITFNKELLPGSEGMASFRLERLSTGGPVPVEGEVVLQGEELRFVPDAPLAPGTVYQAFTLGATSLLSERQTTPYRWAFETTTSSPPPVTRSEPAAGATNVARNTDITLFFGHALKVGGQDVEMKVLGPGEVPVAGYLSWVRGVEDEQAVLGHNSAASGGEYQGFRSLRFQPLRPLQGGTWYEVVVKGVENLAGVAMASPHTWTFRTGFTAGEISVSKTARRYYYFGGQRIAMNEVDPDGSSVLYYLVGDHLGTTSVVLCGQQGGCNGVPLGGKVAESRHYPYGAERWSSGTLPTDYRFTGQRSDGYIKLYAMGARHYDPSLGRWISADPIIPDPANPQSYNRYSYTLEN